MKNRKNEEYVKKKTLSKKVSMCLFEIINRVASQWPVAVFQDIFHI